MLRSLFSGVSGLRSHQTMMDVVGNNIANVNTTGFKASRVAFQDQLSQLIKGGSAGGGAGTDTGGMNAQQVGLGVRVGSIDTVTTQGSLQATGRTTDLGIQGDGYFIVKNAEQTLYTRAGNFGFDNDGNLVDTSGYIVQGFLADPQGTINNTGPAGNLTLPLGQSVPPKPTRTVVIGGNLSTGTPVGESVLTPIETYDSLGNPTMTTFAYTRASDPAVEARGLTRWELTVTEPGNLTNEDKTDDTRALTIGAYDPTERRPTTTSVSLYFNTAGNRVNADGSALGPDGHRFTVGLPGADPTRSFNADLGFATSPTGVHQYGGPTSAAAYTQDGSPTGYLRSFSIGDDGVFTGIYSNGHQVALGQIALASFSNPGSSNQSGLVKMGNNHYRADTNTGTPAVGVPGQLGNGQLAAGMLEMSNVDLAQEFTNLIIAQRGFQANSRIISASDELLQDVVNIKR